MFQAPFKALFTSALCIRIEKQNKKKNNAFQAVTDPSQDGQQRHPTDTTDLNLGPLLCPSF